MGKAIMIQGTGSHVGKSLVATALCRIFYREGYRVAPFKAQNISNNSYVTPDGREISRAQAVQAMACGLEPSVDMNPVLLKPSSGQTVQIVLQGKVAVPVASLQDDYSGQILPVVRGALLRLLSRYDIVVIEGAGSPAEINLKDRDIANMMVARIADAPVLIVGDIDFGGLFAWFIGTLELLSGPDRERVKGFIINKFRGNIDMLEPALAFLRERTGKEVLGIIPYLRETIIPEEDTLPRWAERAGGKGSIVILRLPHISNFTDFEPLLSDPNISARYSLAPRDLRQADVIVLPGTKSTMADLRVIREMGLADLIVDLAKGGKKVVGICGGFQMLGKRIIDPGHVESGTTEIQGLGLLPFSTRFEPQKVTSRVRAIHLASQIELDGYEIHMGKIIEMDKRLQPAFRIIQRNGLTVDESDGAQTMSNIWGTYIHGIFDSPKFRRYFLRWVYGGEPVLSESLLGDYDRLADQVLPHIAIQKIYDILWRKGGY
jgi:adenosylcobyric acid synthase